MTRSYFNKNVNTINADKIHIPKSAKTLNVLSLFSGTGGMDLGFIGGFKFLKKLYPHNPFKIIFSNDNFKQAADLYDDNISKYNGSRVITNRTDIRKLNLRKDMPQEKVDVILGGFPCQTFSYSGNRGGLSDPRGRLYQQMIRVIDYYKPKMFVAENVDGIRNSKKNTKGQNVDESALDVILSSFDKHGYNVQYHVLNAANYGVPQTRRRVIIMGLRKDLGDINDEYYPEKEYNQNGTNGKHKWVSAKEGIDDLWWKFGDPIPPQNDNHHVSHAKFYPGKKMQGNNQIDADRPSPTIRANHHGNIEAHYRSDPRFKDPKKDPKGWRRLDIRECARLQSFPDDFNFDTSTSSAYVAIGNAVPPVMAWNIARSVWFTINKINK